MSGSKPRGKAVLCMLKTQLHDHVFFRVRMDELRRLVETLDLEVVGEFVQTRPRPYARYLMGSGKVGELRGFVERHKVDLVVFYNTLQSNQKLNLIRALGCDVVDLYEVILEIFDLMASDNLSKLQIEAARLDKLYPFFKLQASLKYRTERPFFRSMGEYAYHSQVRAITRQISKIGEKISVLKAEKQGRIRKRRELGYPTVCIAGYYNAGKTSLFNALTSEFKRVSDSPFTTLSSKYQRRYLNEGEFLLFIDTIGFVIDLDPRLIKSFELNLEDMRNADVVLLLLEIADSFPVLSMKLREGVKLLEELGVDRDRIVVVFNKIDLLEEVQVREVVERLRMEDRGYDWICVSAEKRMNLKGLLETIKRRINEVGVNHPSMAVKTV